jgi:hypothetical protein
MLAGCLALTNSLSWVSIPTSKLLILIWTLNLYEAALIGLAAYLVLARGLRRDGMILIILEVFFLIDITFLVSEIATRKSWLGPAIAGVVFIAAIIKLAAVMRILNIRRAPAEFLFILIQLAAILAIPILFSRYDDGSVPPRVFYIAWWVVGLMPAAYELLAKYFRSSGPASPLSRIMMTYMLLPWLSLVAHLGILHYVYGVAFCAPMSSPLLLAIALTLNRASPTRLFSRRDFLVLQTLLPLAAIFVSSGAPAQLTFILDHAGHLAITTYHLTIIATYLEFIYFFLRPYWLYPVVAGVIAALAYSFGPTTDQIELWASQFWNWISNVLPTTQTGWGETAVVAAFIFLGIGAAISLSRPLSPPE